MNNSIDFISIAASVLVAIETNKWIESRKDKKTVNKLIADLYIEILSIHKNLLKDKAKENENMLNSKLTLRIEPYKCPIWNSILQTNKITLLTNKSFYKKMLNFYDSLSATNNWENTLTEFVLLNTNYNSSEILNEYKFILINQISEERSKTILFADDILKELLNDDGNTNNLS